MKKSLTLAFALATFGNLNAFAAETTSIDGVKNIMCTMEYAPVCGQKDGNLQTYGNKCTAGAAGASILYDGECTMDKSPVICNDDCGVGRPGQVFNPFEGNEYKISSYNGKGLTGNYVLNFLDGKISAKICNSMNGSYSISGENILAPKMISTLMACFGEAGDVENNFKIDGSSFSTDTNGNLNIKTKDGNIFGLTQISKSSNFDFQGDWKLKSYDGKDVAQNIVLNFSGDTLSTKICNNFWGKYSLSGENTTYNLTSTLASTRMMCDGELGQIEKDLNLSSAEILLPMDTQNYMMIQTNGKNFQFERVTKKPSLYPVPKTTKVNGYINFRATNLLNNIENYMNQNGVGVEDMISKINQAIEKINNIQMVSDMTPIQNAKLELQKKVYQATIQSLNNL